MNSAQKLAVPVLVAVTVIWAVFLVYTPNNSALLTTTEEVDLSPIQLGKSRVTYKTLPQDKSKVLVNGPWRTQREFRMDNDDTYKASSRADVNKILWDYWNAKQYGDQLIFTGNPNPRRNLSSDYYDPQNGLEHWEPDWFNKSDLHAVLTTRMSYIQSHCKAFRGTRNRWVRRVHRVTPHTTSIKLCCHAKAGSTFWKSVIRSLSLEPQRKSELQRSEKSVSCN